MFWLSYCMVCVYVCVCCEMLRPGTVVCMLSVCYIFGVTLLLFGSLGRHLTGGNIVAFSCLAGLGANRKLQCYVWHSFHT